MNIVFGKRQRRFLGLLGWFLLIPALCFVDTLTAQSDEKRGLELPQVVSNGAYLLGSPKNGGPVVVRTAFQLQDIDEIDDEAETFQFTGVLTLTWQDKRQAFDPDKERVKEKIYQGGYQFNEVSPAWYPQVVLANESGMYEKHGVLLRVQPDGTSTLIEQINAIAKANFNMRRYPFDAQRLEAIFEVFGFYSSEVVFKAEPTPVDPSWQEVRISQWQLADVRSLTGEHIAPSSGKRGTSSTFTVRMEVQRNSFFIVRLIAIPLTFIVVLSWSVFWMDRSSLGDRINISFIGILTAVAYQFIVSGILPHFSYFTLMNAFINLSFFAMCATVVINLIVGGYDKKGRSDAGDLIDYRCRWIFPLVYFGLLLLAVAISFIFF